MPSYFSRFPSPSGNPAGDVNKILARQNRGNPVSVRMLHRNCMGIITQCGSLLIIKILITVRNEVAKVMFLQACVCPHGGGGVCLSAYWDAPWEQTPPRSRHPPWEQTSPRSRHPPPPGETATAADGTHPTGMHSCFVIDLFHFPCLLFHCPKIPWFSFLLLGMAVEKFVMVILK